MKVTVTLLFCLIAYVCADLYMQNPRGCNDRLNEANTNRNNNNRLFDSQNNAKGGYCYGTAMSFYEGSELTIEWTNQHGCGTNPKVACNMVVQYMCGTSNDGDYFNIRDGSTTDTITNDPTGPTSLTNGVYTYGMHESYQSYQDCTTRTRNLGLYIADRAAQGGITTTNAADVTRQNNNGGRSGLECPEERDYYPYWHPTQWRDVAILTWNTNFCSFYQTNSQNVMSKGYCQPKSGIVTDPTQPAGTADNNPTSCAQNGNTWVQVPSWGLSAPDCQPVPLTRENHNGNSGDMFTPHYNWTLPRSSDLPCMSTNDCNCVLRLRYNISTIEDGFPNMANPYGSYVDSTYNGKSAVVNNNGIVYQDTLPHQLATDTTQFGRTFQDRSYVFHILSRPSNIPTLARIYNLNVRGKRGNVVETYPATEYDFVPQYLYTRVGDYVHFQWTGCDTNPAGNAGEGTDQTDRHNMVQVISLTDSHPATDTWIASNPSSVLFTDPAFRVTMAMLNQVGCLNITQLATKDNNNVNTEKTDLQNCMKLNAAEPYFDGGANSMNNTGTFNYISSRNNNFSNRDQKGVIFVLPLLPAWAVGVVVGGSALFVGAIVVGGLMFYAKSHPHSNIASWFSKI